MAECQRCQFQAVVSALSLLVQTFPRRQTKNGKVVMTDLNRAELTLREASDGRVRRAAKAFCDPYNRLVDFINDDLLPLAREICLFCSTASNDEKKKDEKLTMRGRNFVYLDSMPNGVALSDDQDSSTPGSWLNKNTIRPIASSSDGVSQLPTHIDDTIRKVMHDFNELDVFDQNMLLHQMTGATMTDFATMKWVPHEMKRAQSKEFVDYRWRRLLSRFPLAAAIKKARPLTSSKSKRGKSDGIGLVQDEMDLLFKHPHALKKPKD